MNAEAIAQAEKIGADAFHAGQPPIAGGNPELVAHVESVFPGPVHVLAWDTDGEWSKLLADLMDAFNRGWQAAYEDAPHHLEHGPGHVLPCWCKLAKDHTFEEFVAAADEGKI